MLALHKIHHLELTLFFSCPCNLGFPHVSRAAIQNLMGGLESIHGEHGGLKTVFLKSRENR